MCELGAEKLLERIREYKPKAVADKSRVEYVFDFHALAAKFLEKDYSSSGAAFRSHFAIDRGDTRDRRTVGHYVHQELARDESTPSFRNCQEQLRAEPEAGGMGRRVLDTSGSKRM